MVGAGSRAHVIFWGYREGVIDHTASLFCPLFLLGHVLKAMVASLVFWLLSTWSGSRGPSWPTQPQPGSLDAEDPFKPLPHDLSGPMEDSLGLSSSEYYGNWWVIYVIQKPRAEQ